jgi:hypothetical protein
VNIEEIKAFQTSDGKMYKSIEDAKSHEAELELRESYENNPIHDDWGSRVSFLDVLQFIINNADIIRRML